MNTHIEELLKGIRLWALSKFAKSTDLTGHTSNTTIHVTSSEKSTWNGKQDAISDLESIRTGAGIANSLADWAKAAEKPTYTAAEVGALPSDTFIPTKTSDITNDSGFITKSADNLDNYYTKSEIDTNEEVINDKFVELETAIAGKASSVHSHAIADVTGLQTALDGKSNTGHGHVISDVTGLQTALDGKAASDHTHTAAEIGAIDATEKGAANGVAQLDANGKVPTAQLPSFVDDVIEGYMHEGKFYKEAAHTTEIEGESGKIYVDLVSNKTYRWSGSQFTEISESLALGETSSTAYAGDKGKANADAIAVLQETVALKLNDAPVEEGVAYARENGAWVKVYDKEQIDTQMAVIAEVANTSAEKAMLDEMMTNTAQDYKDFLDSLDAE